MIILSFDCAIKTMGVVMIYYNENWINEFINEFLKNNCKITKLKIKNLLKIINNKKILIFEVANLCSAKIKIADKIMNLHKYTNELNNRISKILINEKFTEEKFGVVIERQNPNNHNSVPISHCLLYEYSAYKPCLIGASMKNQIELDLNTSFGHFIERYKSSYTARKKHSENNLIVFLKLIKRLDLIDEIKKKDDVADALNQIFAYIKEKLSNEELNSLIKFN